MNELQLTQWKKNYEENSFYYRGKLIDNFANLEKTLESYLVKYFNPTDFDEFQNVILDRLTFEAKRTAFRAILDKESIKNGFIKTKSNSYPHSKFLDEIRLLNDHRNYFAHYFLIVPLIPDDSIICLAEFRDSLKLIKFTFDDYQHIIFRISKAIIKIVSMSRKIHLSVADVKLPRL